MRRRARRVGNRLARRSAPRTSPQIFLAKHTFSPGSFGYGLLYGAIGAGLVLGAFFSARQLDALRRRGDVRRQPRRDGCRATSAPAASPNVWVAAACCVVSGSGTARRVACNALLVQRGTFDVMRGRALTFVMSATYRRSSASARSLGGVFVHDTGARSIWAALGVGDCWRALGVAGLAGCAIARKLGGERREAELAPSRPIASARESTPVAAAN